MLRSNEWLPALSAPNVEVVFDRIEEITPRGIMANGVERNVDVIIYATGFRVPNYLGGIDIVGPSGKSLHEVWREEGIGAYLGMSMPGFPNLFLMYGPGTNAANSIFYILESQARYISQWWRRLGRERIRSFDVRRSAYDRYQKKFIQATEGTVWASGCTNYVVDENGVPRTNWPFRASYYRLLTFRPKLADFDIADADRKVSQEATDKPSTKRVAS
jgi:cation diffusion facilitator CzcD-associated flavoprotein CzcO